MESDGVHLFKTLRLSAMMFLQYFIYGSWYATAGLAMAKYGFSSIIGLTYSLVAVASIISPIILGVVADRFLSSEKVIGTLHAIGGILLLFIPNQMESGQQNLFLCLLFLYMLILTPTFALTNNVAFHHIKDPSKHFPVIRVFGTIGWIAAGVGIGQCNLSDSSLIFTIAGIASFVQGIYSFTLPSTPAPAKGKAFTKRELLRIDAFKMMKDRAFLIFMLTSLFLNIPIASYSSFASPFLGAMGYHHVGSLMSIGQGLEIFFMLAIPFLMARFSIKRMLFIGMIAWVVRFGLFAMGAPSGIDALIIIGIAIHGICINFFMIPGTIFVERMASRDIKAQAQSLFVLFTQGIGTFIGSLISGLLYNSTMASSYSVQYQWTLFWSIPTIIALLVTVFFVFAFRMKNEEYEKTDIHVVQK